MNYKTDFKAHILSNSVLTS